MVPSLCATLATATLSGTPTSRVELDPGAGTVAEALALTPVKVHSTVVGADVYVGALEPDVDVVDPPAGLAHVVALALIQVISRMAWWTQ